MQIRRIHVPLRSLQAGRDAMQGSFTLQDVADAVRRSNDDVGVDAGDRTGDEFALEIATRLVAKASDQRRIAPEGADAWRSL